MQSSNRLENFPISFFAMIMGLSGLTISWEKAAALFQLGLSPATGLLWLTSAVFIVLATLYATKVVRYQSQVVAELRHPVKLNFFPAISISLLLLSVAWIPMHEGLSEILWMTGASLHLMFTLYVVNIWIHHDHFEVHHMNPAWFIPAVGNVLVPVAGTHYGYMEISWFFFSVGMLFWVILLTIIFNRILFHNPIDERLMPTMFILIAPPAVGFISYMKLTGDLDSFARFLYFSGLFLTLLLLTQAKRFIKLQFFLSWWAYSFPSAAITIATLLMYEKTGLTAYRYLGMLFLTLLSMVLLVLIVKTAKAVMQHKICVSEKH
ncbi:MAG: SLAC1 anion channel family protein [Candidatus Thiodiazotropha sp.]|jgi:tellurite resistance protein